VLGSSVPGALQSVQKALALPKSHIHSFSSSGGRWDACNAKKARHPSGAVWRREREADAGAGREREAILLFGSPLVFATVEGTQVSERTAPFAGCRTNEDLGWSATSARESSRSTERTSDNGCSRVAEEGNVRQRAPCARNPARWGAIATAFWGRVLRSVLRPAHAHRHTHFTGSKNLAKVARRGTHRPPAILRKQGKTDDGATSTGRARLAARSPPSSGGSAWPGETEEGCGLRPARKMQLRVVLVRRNAVAEVVGRCLTSNKPAVRTLKRVADASERGSSAELGSAHMRRRRSRVKKHRESVRGGHRLRVRPGPRVV
jgi:hypothetical protein